MRRKVVIALIALLGLAGFLSFRQGPGTPMSAESLPARLSDGAVNSDGRRQHSVATVPLVPSAALRRMHPGDALLIHGTLPPAHIRLRPWYRDRHLRDRATLGTRARS